MKTIQEILAPDRSPSEIISDLKMKTIDVPKYEELMKEYDPTKHRIMTDKAAFPDKILKDENGNPCGTERITRICIGLQRLAVKRMSEFMFGLPVNHVFEENEDKTKKEQFAAVKKVLKKNRINTINKHRCKVLSSECEQATLWYVVESDNKNYGFQSKYKLKCMVLSPGNGDELYPLFDDTGDMVAFSRGWTVQENDGKKKQFFQTWTADEIYKWESGDGSVMELSEGFPKENILGKIPVVYQYRKTPIWADADNGKIHEMEVLLSRNGDVIAYHAAPVLIIRGQLQGVPTKGDSNKVFTTTEGGAEYVAWQQSIESVRFQFETLMRSFFMELQLPDLSFENIKGLGAQSGESRKMLLVDAHLKVGDEAELYEEIIEREYNIIKAFLGVMNAKWKTSIEEIEIEPEIRPFMIEDEKARVDVLVSANGGKPLVSQKLSAMLSGLSEDAAADYEQMRKEAEEDGKFSIIDNEPTE
jgi:hypothetical protein